MARRARRQPRTTAAVRAGALLACLSLVAPRGAVGHDAQDAQSSSAAAATTAIDLGNAFAAAAGAARHTVVYIRTETVSPGGGTLELPASLNDFGPRPAPGRTMVGTGTGFIVRRDGYIVTNHHVIHDARRVFVRLVDQREYEAEIVGTDPLTDLAVVRIPVPNLATAALGDSDDLRVGEWVLAIGNPLGTALTFSVTAGIVSATSRAVQDPAADAVLEYIQTDAVANRGNSGGPLVDLRGRIVGLNAVIASESGYYQGYTLAIPINLVVPVAARLIRYGRVPRSDLGVMIANATPEDADAVGLAATTGAVIAGVPGARSPVARAGLQAGDVIVGIDGRAVASAAAVHRDLWFREPGDTARLTVVRANGVRRTYAVRLATGAIEYHAEGRGPHVAGRSPCAENALALCFRVVDEKEAQARGLPARYAGLEITAVYSLGPANGRLHPRHDIVTHINDRRVRSAAEFTRALERAERGSIITVRTYRVSAGRQSFIRLRLRP